MEQINYKICRKRLFLLDIDGTIAYGNTLFDGTMDFLNQVALMGGKYIFITNNSTKSIKDYIAKFRNWKIPVDKSNFLTASYVTAAYLKEHYPDQLLFCVGTKSFIQELQESNLMVTEQLEENLERVKAAVVGYDNELTYQKIEEVCKLLQTRNVDYIATNPDFVCPVEYGYLPDCGAICDFIKKAVKKEPVYIGKPNRKIVDLAIENTPFTREETIVIGDRLYTDIACGIQAHVDTIVVFTGEAKREELNNTKFVPTYYCDEIKQIYQILKEGKS